jgi:hypothetical protein
MNVHRSNAQELIAKVPVIEVEADVALCDGGTQAHECCYNSSLGLTNHVQVAVQLGIQLSTYN